MFRDIRPDKPREPQRGRTKNNLERGRYNYSMERRRNTAVQTASAAAVGNITVTGSTIAKFSVRGPNEAPVFVYTVAKIFQKVCQLHYSRNLQIFWKEMCKYCAQ